MTALNKDPCFSRALMMLVACDIAFILLVSYKVSRSALHFSRTQHDGVR